MRQHFLLLTLFCTSAAQLAAHAVAPPPNALAFLRTAHRLDLLYTSLYGTTHPFKKQVTHFERLAFAYAKLIQPTVHNKRSQRAQEKTSEAHTALSILHDYATRLLEKYEFEKQAFSHAPLPAHALPRPNRSLPQLDLSPAPHVVPAQIDRAVRELVTADNAVTQQEDNERKHILRDQISLLLGGMAFLILFTIVGRYLLTPSIREVLRKAEKTTRNNCTHQGHIAQGTACLRGII